MSDGSEATEIYIGLGGGGAPDGPRQSLVLKRANRHGLIAGATGTGKTVTLQGLAEGFSAVGVPVFVADPGGLGERHRRLHETLYAARQARPLVDAPTPFDREPLDETGRVAFEIAERFLHD